MKTWLQACPACAGTGEAEWEAFEGVGNCPDCEGSGKAPSPMKAITIKQPWAGLIASGQKTLELRKWRVEPQTILVCSAKKPALDYSGDALGITICTVEVVDLVRFEEQMASQACIPQWMAKDWAGCWAWVLRNPQPVEARPVSGKLGLFTLR